MFHKVNEEQRLYVLEHQDGYTCLGFDVAIRKGKAVAEWLSGHGQECPPPDESLKGTKEGYEDYERIMAMGQAFSVWTNKRCGADLTPQLMGKEGQRVEVVDRHGEKRRFWVGRSMGWLPIHLEIKTRSSSGGGGVTGAPFKIVRVLELSR